MTTSPHQALKEYLVGGEVFDRVPDFDPRTDTIVRVEARRLRKKPSSRSSFVTASLFKVFVYLSQGRIDLAAATEARCGCRSVVRVYAQAKLGDAAGAHAELQRPLSRMADPLTIAAAYAGLGEPEHVLDWIEKAADAKIPQMVWIHFQAPFESLHGTASYREIRKPNATSLVLLDLSSSGDAARPTKRAWKATSKCFTPLFP